MIFIFIAIVTGIALGYFFNKQDRSRDLVEFVLNGLFIVLILIMGISLGTNDELIRDFYGLGIQSLVLSVSGVVGSIVVIFISSRIIEKKT